MANKGRCISSLDDFRVPTRTTRAAYDAFFFTRGYGTFWGSGSHNEGLIRAVHRIVPRARLRSEFAGASIIDAGAGRYNVVGGDISHFVLYLKLWGCPPGRGALLGYEPVRRQWEKLRKEVQEALPPSMAGRVGSDGEYEVVDRANRTCMVLSQSPLSDRVAAHEMQNMPWASDNTASLEPHFHHDNRADAVKSRRADARLALRHERQRRQRLIRSSSLDVELERRGLPAEVLAFRMDMEAHACTCMCTCMCTRICTCMCTRIQACIQACVRICRCSSSRSMWRVMRRRCCEVRTERLRVQGTGHIDQVRTERLSKGTMHA